MKNSKLKIGITIGVCAVIAFVCIGTIVTLDQQSHPVSKLAEGVGIENTTTGQGASSQKNDSAYTYNNNANNNNKYTYNAPDQKDNIYPKEDTQYVDSYAAAMTVKTNDIDKTYNDFCQKVADTGGEIYQHSYYYDDEKGTGHAWISMLVPNEKYESILTIARNAGTVISEDTYIQKIEVPDESSSDSSESETKANQNNYRYYGQNQYDMSKYSELTIAFSDDEPNFIQLNELKDIAMIATNIFLGLVLFLIPVSIAIIIIVLAVKALKKSHEKKQQTAVPTPVSETAKQATFELDE